ncbi:MAG: hypothetical protein A2057_15705 [Ignavibacteria bacterium GWA2_35_9]|nr:MAG: hypothetical protein A2057_15705 [Ignavibacteria bacterium GWA2_35_9]OGU44912.1 MAG: hypothetical protein A2000_07385 [Ignavibacteria bacterium GWB2_36_8]OGU51019.1 MAG: hypothetical protein A2080_08855 [Ignavibacteria bacterium GWC2_36_12]
MSKREKIKKVNKVDILIISNQYDYTTDYVCIELSRRNTNYLRLNRDSFTNYQIKFNVNLGELYITCSGNNYLIDDSLKSVYYRAPTHFRETFIKKHTSEQQLYNSQWMSFVRNLTFFESAKWMNNPLNTFKAENKLLQLKYASSLGFQIPETIVANDISNLDLKPGSQLAVKALDTALFTIGQKEAFFYTNIVESDEIIKYNAKSIPLVYQNNLHPKIDYRVTVAGEDIYCAKILNKGNGIIGDWRKQKYKLDFIDCNLPLDVKTKCFDLTSKFKLHFGGIDLIESKDGFYFIEINPTGEWAWLVDAADHKVYKSIAGFLI